MATVEPFTPMNHELCTKRPTAPTNSMMAAISSAKIMEKVRVRLRWCSSTTPSSSTSTTTTVTLSCPPAVSAAATRLSAAICGLGDETATASISESSTIEESPSEQMTMRSPDETAMLKWSAYMSGSEPSARVMTEREGCVRASSAVISPASTSSST